MPPYPRFPPEILEHIIFDALANHFVSTPSILSSYALVSRLWRAHTNGHRFRTVEIYIDDDTTPKLQALAEICTSKLWLAHESVSRDIQHCTLIRGSRPLNDLDIFERSSERDAAVVVVLRSIFRHCVQRCHSQDIATTVGLSICAGNYSIGASRGFSFQTLGAAIISALDDLVRAANLEHLELDRVWDVPWRFVICPTLVHLQLKSVSFIRPDAASAEFALGSRRCTLPKLDDIRLEYSPSFMAILLDQGYVTPPPVTKICFAYDCTRQEQIDYNDLYHLGAQVDSLGLEFTGGFMNPCRVIDYSKIHALSYLSLKLQVNINHGQNFADDPIPIPAFESAVRLLPSAPPNNMRILFSVCIFYYDTPPCSRKCIADVYPRIFHPSFLEYLRRITSAAGEVSVELLLLVSIHVYRGAVFDPDTYTAHEVYLRRKFARLDRIPGVSCDVLVGDIADLETNADSAN